MAVTDILKPHGRLIGVPGRSKQVRELPGGSRAAERLFDRLAAGGLDVPTPGYPGRRVKLPNGDTIGYRAASTSGPPTIDLQVAGIGITKLKFREH